MTRAEALAEFDRKLLQETLERYRGDKGKVAKAARELGLNRQNFYRLCERRGVTFPKIRTGHRGTWHGC